MLARMMTVNRIPSQYTSADIHSSLIPLPSLLTVIPSVLVVAVSDQAGRIACAARRLHRRRVQPQGSHLQTSFPRSLVAVAALQVPVASSLGIFRPLERPFTMILLTGAPAIARDVVSRARFAFVRDGIGWIVGKFRRKSFLSLFLLWAWCAALPWPGSEKVARCCGTAMFRPFIGGKAPRWVFLGCGRTSGGFASRWGGIDNACLNSAFWGRISITKTWSAFSNSSQLCFVGNGNRRIIPEPWSTYVLLLFLYVFTPFSGWALSLQDRCGSKWSRSAVRHSMRKPLQISNKSTCKRL